MPTPPKYFKENAMMNKQGYNSYDDVIQQGNKALEISEFKNYLLNPDIVLLDVRHQKEFIKKHIPNSIFIGLNGSCLLYTSPSPRDISGSRMPSSA